MLIAGALLFSVVIIGFGVIKLCYPVLMERFDRRFTPEALRDEGKQYRWGNRIMGLVFIVFGLVFILGALVMILRGSTLP
jgi:threonine/homoserine/homoserine lactone efflux protein